MTARTDLTGWALLGPDGGLRILGVGDLYRTKSLAITNLTTCDPSDGSRLKWWAAWRKDGFSVRRVRVTVEVVETDGQEDGDE